MQSYAFRSPSWLRSVIAPAALTSLCTTFARTSMARSSFIRTSLVGTTVLNMFALSMSVLGVSALGGAQTAHAQSDQLVKALSFKARQDDVTYDQVAPDKVAGCSIEEIAKPEGKGFLITGDSGQTLRWFVDTNGDKRPDRWCYYSQGVETYREIDTDFDGSSDEYRWLGTGGIRWGVDKDGDGRIDQWRMISAEEVTSEVIQACSKRDANRFSALLLSDAELDALKLGPEKTEVLRQKIKDARSQFKDWVAGQNVVTRDSHWTHFGAEKPGIVPAGTDGAAKDIVVYENVVALLETASKPQQLLCGTLIQIDDAWRLVDLPRAITEGTELSDVGVFFNGSFTNRGQLAAASMPNNGMNKSMELMLNELQKVDDRLQSAAAPDRARLHSERADVLEKLISASSSDEDKSTWIKQFADTVNAAAQTGEYPDGVKRLSEMQTKLASVTKNKDDLAYLTYRTITADYTQKIQKTDADFPAAQKSFLKQLEDFVKEYPETMDSADAMVQIAMNAEMVGDPREALKWYGQCSAKFPKELIGRKAAGAMDRINLAGQRFFITGRTLDGKELNTKSDEFSNGPVIYHYWASWCEPCKAEMRALKELQSKYAKNKLRIVGINVDNDAQIAKDFLKQNPYPWTHVYEQGGLDGKLAVGLGVFNLPVNVVVDSQAKVIKSGIHYSELDAILEKLVK